MDTEQRWDIMIKKNPFSRIGYEFVAEGLNYTVDKIHGSKSDSEFKEDPSRHIFGDQLCLGLRDYAICKYGMLAKTVLNRWGIQCTDDFGIIVFAMIEAGFMNQSTEDLLEDFKGIYNFEDAFASDMDN